ncbi:MAG TPA: nuclear transport factor 2 family protein [Fluviicola sp.]|nr:nuclear transport factor 2 family protein [Fluviicola sp.]
MKKLLIIVCLFVYNQHSFAQSITVELDSLLDQWYQAAATSNFKVYFDFMDEDFVFLGTDPSERWTKQEFASFCKPYFDAGKGWDFKKIERTISLSKNGKMAWFDETIDTWMNVCRGSGVLVKKKKEWKIIQYNLAVLIENGKMNQFLRLRNQ